MKKLFLITFSLLFVLQIASGISKVAVLDASLGEGVSINAAAIVADTLNEQFVKSNDFIAIDRAYISKIQAEKKFQLSGEVSSNDIKELGALFGAEFICVANVSKLGSTYTVSARMIDVKTAQVVSQESARKQGEIDVLFNVAETVGSKLIGKEIAPTETQPAQEKPAPSKPTPAKTTSSSEKPKAFSRTTVSYMIPAFSGSGYDLLYSWLEAGMGVGGFEPWTGGIDVHSLITIDRYFYLAVSGSYGFEYITSYITNLYYDYDTDYLSFSNLDLRITAGGILPIGNIIQFFGGLGLGYQDLIISDEAWDTSTFYESEYGAFVLGGELGGDLRFGNLVLSIRMQISSSIFPGYSLFDAYEEDFGYTAFMIGLGSVF